MPKRLGGVGEHSSLDGSMILRTQKDVGAHTERRIRPPVLCICLCCDALETTQRPRQKGIKPTTQVHERYVYLVKMRGEAGGPTIRSILRVSKIGNIPVGYPFQRRARGK